MGPRPVRSKGVHARPRSGRIGAGGEGMIHGVDVLESLADDGNPLVRDWARTRLAVVAPERLRERVPQDGWDATFCGLRTPVIDALLPHVRAGRPWAVLALRQLGGLGAWPEDVGPIVNAAREGLAHHAGPCAEILLAAGVADAGILRAVLAEAAPDRAVAGAIALLLAEPAGILDETAREVAAGLDLFEVGLALDDLGVRRFTGVAEIFDDPEAAAGYGAIVGGGDETLRPPRGAARRRPAAWIHQLLEGVPGPAAALLRALPAPTVDLVAVAGWLSRTEASGDPVADVLERGRESTSDLTAAVRTLTADALQAIYESPPQAHGPRVLALALAGSLPEHRARLVDWILSDTYGIEVQEEAVMIASAAVALEPAMVAGLLADRQTRTLGLLVARYVLDDNALAVLLGLPVSPEPDERADHAAALAGSGDPAAAAPLRELYAFDGDLPPEPRELYEALLGAPLDEI